MIASEFHESLTRLFYILPAQHFLQSITSYKNNIPINILIHIYLFKYLVNFIHFIRFVTTLQIDIY